MDGEALGVPILLQPVYLTGEGRGKGVSNLVNARPRKINNRNNNRNNKRLITTDSPRLDNNGPKSCRLYNT
jgi:hypothetical protein